MKSIRALVALALLAVFLAGTAYANTSSVNPNVPAQNSPLSSSVLRGNFANAQNDLNTIFGILALSSNELLGTINAGNAGPLNLPTCSTGALSWTPGTGFGCNVLNGLVSPITQNLVFTGQHAVNLNATALPTKQTGTVVQVANADTVASRIENDAFSASAYFTGIRADGTNASPTTLQSGDEISGINAWGYNGSSTVGPRASVREFAAQNWTGSAQGTRVDIATTLNNTTTMSPVCGFENDGGVTCPPTVTGGDMGSGRINAAGLYVNGVAVSVGSNALSGITAALANNSIENGAFTSTWNYDTLTTQTALGLSSTSVSTGQLVNATVNNAGSTGYAGFFTNNGTAAAYGIYASETGAANTGYAGYFQNTATATGYALYANGTAKVAGNLTVTGTCTGCGSGGSGTVNSGTTGAVAVYSGSTAVSGAANLFQSTTTTSYYGIGTSTPNYPLDVKPGALQFPLSLTTSYAFGTQILFQNTNGAGGHQLGFGTGAIGTANGLVLSDQTANSSPFGVFSTGTTSGEITALPTGVYAWSSTSQFVSSTVDTGISRPSAGVIAFGTGAANSTAGTVEANQYNLGANMILSATAPTVSSGFGTSPSVANNNGPASFTVNVGTGGSATSGVIGLPAAAHGWNCFATDFTSVATITTACVTTSTTTATCTSYSRTTGTSTAWNASDVLGLSCHPY